MDVYPMTDPTEPRYAETARLMATSGDWITPWFTPEVPFEMPAEGLGLFIVQLICERLGWTLDVGPAAESGTTLTVRFESDADHALSGTSRLPSGGPG